MYANTHSLYKKFDYIDELGKKENLDNYDWENIKTLAKDKESEIRLRIAGTLSI